MDTDIWNAGIRSIALVTALTWAYLTYRSRRPSILPLLVLVVLAWMSGNFPLERLYGLQMPGDRIRNLSWCMTVAAGNSPLTTGIVGGISLEPFWASLVAAISLGSPDRVLAIYPFLPLVVTVALVLVLYRHFSRFDTQSPFDEFRGLLVALFAVLLSTAPLDFMSPFRAFFARMFLLKPNHAIGLLLIPIVYGSVQKSLDGDRRWQWLKSGLWLGFLSVVFVVHWAFVSVCLTVYAVVRAVRDRRVSGPTIWKLMLILAASSFFVAPAVYILLRYFPAALTLARGTYPETPMRSDWGDIMPEYTSLVLQVTLSQGILFFLALIGVAAWLRARTTLAMLWASTLIGAYVLWGLNYLLYLTARAREADEFYYFLIYALAIAAGNGAYELTRFLVRTTRLTRAATNAGVMALLVPMMLPVWWRPAQMDSHFRAALEPIPSHIATLTDWIRHETPGTSVFLVSGDLFQWVPAFSGRRTLLASADVLEALAATEASAVSSTGPIPELADYVIWDSEMEEAAGTSAPVIESMPNFRLAHQEGHVRVYERRRE